MNKLIAPCCVVLAVLLGQNGAVGQGITWTPAAKMLQGKCGQVCGLIHGKIVSAGGTYWAEEEKHWTGDLDIYDPTTDTWSRGPQMPLALSYGAGQAIDNRLYIVSGSDGERDYTNTIICLRYAGTYQYVRGPELPAPRIYAGSVAIGTKLYVIGGAPDHKLAGKLHRDILILDTARPREGWRASRRMPGEGLALTATAAIGENIYVFGGHGRWRGELRNVNTAFVYDTAKDRWRRLPKMPYATRGTDAIALDGQVYLMGGYVTSPATLEREESFTDKILRFDPAAGSYTDAGKMPLPIIGCNPTLLPDGRVFVFGGEDKMMRRTDLAAVGAVNGKR